MDALSWFLVWLLMTTTLMIMAWSTLPPILALLYPTRTHYRFIDSPESDVTMLQGEESQALWEKLETLGFSFLGVKSEQRPLWGGSMEEISFASQEAMVFASIVSVRGKLVYYFYTPFVGGGVLLTANAGFREVKANACSVKVVPSREPEEVFADHRQRLQEFRAKGLVPVEEYTRESRIEATYLYYTSASVRRSLRPMIIRYVFLLGVFLLLDVIVCMVAGTCWLARD